MVKIIPLSRVLRTDAWILFDPLDITPVPKSRASSTVGRRWPIDRYTITITAMLPADITAQSLESSFHNTAIA